MCLFARHPVWRRVMGPAAEEVMDKERYRRAMRRGGGGREGCCRCRCCCLRGDWGATVPPHHHPRRVAAWRAAEYREGGDVRQLARYYDAIGL